MKILAIPATNSRNGINRALLGHVANVLEGGLVADADVEILDLNDYEMPIYSVERQTEGGIPEEALRFYAQIGEADALVISYAEHNGSYSAAWKNLYDWTSRHDMSVYQGKKVVMLAATPGPRAGAGVLGNATLTAPFFGAELVGSMGVGSFYENFDADTGALINEELSAELDATLRKLTDAA